MTLRIVTVLADPSSNAMAPGAAFVFMEKSSKLTLYIPLKAS